MKIAVYYVIRVYKEGHSRIDSGPHRSWEDARLTRDEDHRWDSEKYDIFESFIEGEIV